MSTDNIQTIRFINGHPQSTSTMLSYDDGRIRLNIEEDAVILLDMLFEGENNAVDISISVADGKNAYIIETYSSSAPADVTADCSLSIGKEATLKHQLVNLCPSMRVSYGLKADVDDNSVYTDYQSHLGGSCTSTAEIDLNGYGSSALSQLIAFTAGNQKQSHELRINHGAAIGSSICNIDCVGYIAKGMSGSDAYQKSRIITLSDEAKAHVSPALLIDEYDVSAGHSGSVGGVDSEALYYLQSRGIDRAAAVAMCACGFLLDAADCNNDELYEQLEKRIKKIIKNS